MVVPKEGFSSPTGGSPQSIEKNGYVNSNGMPGHYCRDKETSLTTRNHSEKLSVKSRISFFEDTVSKRDSTAKHGIIRHAKSMIDLSSCDSPPSERDTPIRKEPEAYPKLGAPAAPSRCPFSGKTELKNVRLKNYFASTQQNDTLHLKAKATHCTGNRCMGSLMQPYGGGDENRPYGVPRAKDEVKVQATDFLNEYYASMKQQDTEAHKQRLDCVLSEIEERGMYDLTYNELSYGAKLAWRNAPRCIGRIQWNNLKVFDARSATTATEIFEAICTHIEYGTNGGNIRSTITVFRERREGHKDWRIWYSQLVKYAGYEMSDGTVVGDPGGVEFTKLCERLGWKGPGGKFDVLPLVIECNDEAPVVFDLPKHIVLEVAIKHPQYNWFEELGLKWYALPAVANMKFDVGGVEFPFAPFNGWYMLTEVGARDLGDKARYNMLEPIAERMGLDTKSPSSLWKDRASTELNQAVLHSFQEAKVTLVDHHTASDQFIKHMQNEHKVRGGCPADWVWIVPPSSGSTTEVFHQEMLNYCLKPSFDYQDDAWRHYQFEDEMNRVKITFKQASILARVTKCLMNSIMAKRKKATVLYATETGRSESFAKTFANMLSMAFDVETFCMSDYDFRKIHDESLLIIVTSTFGNGEAPMNGEEFGDLLYRLGNQKSSPAIIAGCNGQRKPLENLRYAVFGLGSSAYPNFCAFAHSCNNLLSQLGGKEVHPIGEGDELSGQEEAFKRWAKSAFEAACGAFSIDHAKLTANSEEDLDSLKEVFDPIKYKFEYIETEDSLNIIDGLSQMHNKCIQAAKVISVDELQSKSSSRSTVLLRLDTEGNESLSFEPGDHVSIFPSNDPAMVDEIIERLDSAPSPDYPITIKKLKSEGDWETVSRLPTNCTLRQALANFIDITTPPTQDMLRLFANLAADEDDKMKLESLATDSKAYEDWKYENFPTVLEVLDDFPSLRFNGIEMLTQLPTLQARYYSISSSPLMYPNEIHATVAVVCYETQGNPRRIHNGVCSHWISELSENSIVPCYIRQAPSFRLPKDHQAPIIMVGPGSGIAPLRSFWQHRHMQRETQDIDSEWGAMDLYSGCRRFKEDNIYQEEKQQMLNDGTLDHTYLALSREARLKKTYVQHMVKKHGKDVYHKIVNQHGHVYVCGDVAMAADVYSVICEILQEKALYTQKEARDFVKQMKSSGHYHEDIFGVTKISVRGQREEKPQLDHIDL